MSKITSIMPLIRLMRPHQYLKNGLIILPLFFSGRVIIPELLLRIAVAIVVFSIVASGVYIMNDLLDVRHDRLHPEKRRRPIAAGEVSVPVAVVMLLLLIGAGLFGAQVLGTDVLGVMLFYVGLNIIYSLWLRHISIIDVMVVAICFVVRLFVGGMAADVRLTMWIVLVTFLLALFLALAKRRDDVAVFTRTGEKMRESVDGYSLAFLDSAMVVMAAVTIFSYIMYTISPEVEARMGTQRLYLSVGFVILGVLRYLQITMVEQRSGSPTLVLIRDRMIQFAVLGWVGFFVYCVYWLRH